MESDFSGKGVFDDACTLRMPFQQINQHVLDRIEQIAVGTPIKRGSVVFLSLVIFGAGNLDTVLFQHGFEFLDNQRRFVMGVDRLFPVVGHVGKDNLA